ncbi:ketoacyl-synthetase-like protein [Chitinophaga niastensis]|uniref:Ketoacyl-synthetase-like protein n=1 Tax=Chitinophaga niastensis TaxID=536980 RepID=A0A2P8HPN2_CHINA|nr:type I polyketide synthase [Chitinophaga niastensis]PSL48188.1 ketoacyl-synthetase-like protein [Chitinophaga niastensis]
MSAQEVLKALQAGEISMEEARSVLEKMKRQAAPLPEIPVKQENKVKYNVNEPTSDVSYPERIAIVGMSGRYPGAGNLRQYWDNLEKGRDCVREVPVDRWNVNEFYAPLPYQKGKVYCKWLGALDDIALFDPLFFSITPLEAEGMDPQQRLFLQEAYKSFEDAGYTRQTLSNKKCAVYLGIMSNEYGLLQYKSQAASANITGNSFSIAAARVAYNLNLKGPAISIDTACSSSLVATHLACQALLNREVDMALAGGVTLYLTAESYMGMCSAGMLSPEGRCKTFDDSANGFVPGEGVGALVLKRLTDAVADKDPVYGVIIGSGINQDGKTNGMTAPSVNSQIELEREIYERYKIDPQSISYVEMHGTGTKLGDPIELEALSTVFKEKTSQRNFCALGSVKSNIGHTSAAAGVASVQKVLLAMQHQQLVPTLHFSKPNEHFNFDDSPFYVNTSLQPWVSTAATPRRAAISSFGYSGTNAHLVIEEYQSPATPVDTGVPLLFVLSAKSEEQLKEYAAALYLQVSAQEDIVLSDIAWTLQTGRQSMEYRMAFVADTKPALLTSLLTFTEQATYASIMTGKVGKKIEEEEEHIKPLLETWLQKKELLKLAALWIRGLTIDWNRLYQEVKPRRISLPTYPFARERYWVPDVAVSQTTDEPLRAGLNETASRRSYFLEKQWEPAPATTSGKTNGPVLILSDSSAKTLAGLVGAHFPGSDIFYIDEDQLPVVLQKVYSGCINLLGCGTISDQDLSWLPPLQQLIEQGGAGLLLLAVSRGLESAEVSLQQLSGALSAGLFRMLQNEYRQLRSRHMDVAIMIDDVTLASLIVSEYNQESREPEIVYRQDGQRYRALLSALTLPAATAGTKVQFGPEEVLLITGGTRGIGALCAVHFVKNYAVKRLVLCGREPLPARDTWHTYTTDSITGIKIAGIQALEALGAQVEVLTVPLTDKAAFVQALSAITSKMGPVKGIIHSAGMTDPHNPAFIRKRMTDISAVLAPKVAGLNVLYEIFKAQPLHCFVLFSSVSAAMPVLGAGQSDYVMGNAYMDYFSSAHRSACPLISIQWPSWEETGMGAVKGGVYAATGLHTLLNEEGVGLLDQVLASGRRGVLLAAVADPAVFNPAIPPDNYLLVPETAPSRAAVITENNHSLLADVRQWLLELFGRELRIPIEKLDADTPFQDYGVDSILLAQLLRQINKEIPEALDPSLLFEYPSLSSLSVWLTSHYGAVLSAVVKNTVAANKRIPVEVISAGTTVKTENIVAAPVNSHDNDIAVIGMSCRFAGAVNLDAYWKLLSEGRSGLSALSGPEWNAGNSPVYGGLLEDKGLFDPAFFLLPASDVPAMDPQALIVLEESLLALCHAGYSHTALKGQPVGVYMGGRSQHQPSVADLLSARNPIVAVGQNYLAANVSHFFDLRGPAVVVDTACSSSLVALHMAAQALQTGEIRAALVGGVSLLQPGGAMELFQQRGLLNRGNAFHVFDARASGVLLSEGAGMLVVKRLADAQAAGDRVYGVIKSVAVNNDGRTAGPASPNLQAQKEVMLQGLIRSGYQPGDISYIEANGSGSAVTDLLELKAIEEVYRSAKGATCMLGSIKPNIGHPLCAEGMAGLIKVLLMLHHKEIVPFLSGQQPMLHYDIGHSPFSFCRERTSWDISPAVAGINCFADGGTNVHVIVSAAPAANTDGVTRNPLPLPLMQRRPVRNSVVTPHVKAYTEKNTMSQDSVRVTSAWKKTASVEKIASLRN